MTEELVIAGGGYGGMYLLRTVLDSLPGHVRITLIDRLPKSSLKTEFYSVAAGTASLKEVTVPFPSHPQLRTIYDEVTGIDQRRRRLCLREQGEIPYDTFVVSLGCVDRFHGIPGAEEHSLSLQTLKKTQVTGQGILTLDAYRTVALIGAGLTGVELAAELRESRPDLNILLVDRNDRVLNGFSDKMRDYVENWLIHHDVTVKHGVQTHTIAADHLTSDKDDVPFDKLVWTAGIQANPFVRQLDAGFDNIGRVVVDKWLQIPSDPAIFVIGDCAAGADSPTAQLAEYHGEFLGETMLARWSGQEPKMREFESRGTLGSLGKRAGFGTVAGRDISGKVPRLLKSGVLWSYKRHVNG